MGGGARMSRGMHVVLIPVQGDQVHPFLQTLLKVKSEI